jgi:ElaB/YqjD/DUF883 family membrane-anchored ribosome-binding protein
MATEYFHTGSVYSMDPGYGQVLESYQSRIGLATDPRTANQLQEISKKLNVGARAIELSTVSADIFESIPDQHLEEIRRLSKLTGTDLTLHAPIVEPSGFDQNLRFSEANRVMSERQMLSAVERAKIMSKEGNMPVTFHASAGLPEGLVRVKEEIIQGAKPEEREVVKGMAVVDPIGGDIKMIKERERFFPEKEEKGAPFEKRELDRLNEEVWIGELNQLTFYANRGQDIIEGTLRQLGKAEKEQFGIKEEKEKEQFEDGFFKGVAAGKNLSEEEKTRLLGKWSGAGAKETMKDVEREFGHAQVYLRDSYGLLKNLYNRVYGEIKESAAAGDEKAIKDKQMLDDYSKKIRPFVEGGIEKDSEKLKQFAGIIEDGIKELKEIKPHIFRPLNDFVIEKSAETFGNVAWKMFQNAKPEERNKLPIISIENPPTGVAISRAEELKKLIEESRHVFEKKAEESGMSSSEARKKAEQLIGATWDVGHINMLRKFGYGEKDLLEQTKKIAPMVKNVHLSDNFGMEHTELPMGMGTVPIQKMLKQLEKEGFSGKKIIEAGNWYQHFKTIPMRETLAGMNMPVYTAKEAPYWTQAAGTYGKYFAGYGTFLPEEHVSMYGAGFSGLPTELGGQVPGKQSRFSGAPME